MLHGSLVTTKCLSTFGKLQSYFFCSLDLTSPTSGTANAGLASVGGACGDFPVSVNEFGNTGVYAHELGHK